MRVDPQSPLDATEQEEEMKDSLSPAPPLESISPAGQQEDTKEDSLTPLLPLSPQLEDVEMDQVVDAPSGQDADDQAMDAIPQLISSTLCIDANHPDFDVIGEPATERPVLAKEALLALPICFDPRYYIRVPKRCTLFPLDDIIASEEAGTLVDKLSASPPLYFDENLFGKALNDIIEMFRLRIHQQLPKGALVYRPELPKAEVTWMHGEYSIDQQFIGSEQYLSNPAVKIFRDRDTARMQAAADQNSNASERSTATSRKLGSTKPDGIAFAVYLDQYFLYRIDEYKYSAVLDPHLQEEALKWCRAECLYQTMWYLKMCSASPNHVVKHATSILNAEVARIVLEGDDFDTFLIETSDETLIGHTYTVDEFEALQFWNAPFSHNLLSPWGLGIFLATTYTTYLHCALHGVMIDRSALAPLTGLRVNVPGPEQVADLMDRKISAHANVYAIKRKAKKDDPAGGGGDGDDDDDDGDDDGDDDDGDDNDNDGNSGGGTGTSDDDNMEEDDSESSTDDDPNDHTYDPQKDSSKYQKSRGRERRHAANPTDTDNDTNTEDESLETPSAFYRRLLREVGAHIRMVSIDCMNGIVLAPPVLGSTEAVLSGSASSTPVNTPGSTPEKLNTKLRRA